MADEPSEDMISLADLKVLAKRYPDALPNMLLFQSSEWVCL